jgi:hypothetical protein
MRLITGFLILILLSGCKERSIPASLKNDIDSIAHKWVPDQREGICNIELEKLSGNLIQLKGETDLPEARTEIIRYIEKSGLNCRDSVIILPDTSEIKKIWGMVSVSVSNLKKEPSFASEMVSQSIMGTPVKILKRKGSWMLVQTPDYYIGWVTGSSLSELDYKDFEKWKSSDRIIYTSKAGDIISTDRSKDVVSDIVTGAVLEIKNKQQGCYNVILPDGREGKIPVKDGADFKKWSSEIKPDPSAMISFGKSMLGSPYIWGGTSTKAVDCSGFTKTLFFTCGIILARDASLQFRYGEPGEVTDDFKFLVPGDLIFFGRITDAGEKRITHVGMYAGDIEVIHSSGMVRINSLDPARPNFSSYLKETLMGARRIIGVDDKRGTQRVRTHPWYFDP